MIGHVERNELDGRIENLTEMNEEENIQGGV